MKKFIFIILTLVSIPAISQEVLISHPSYTTSHLTMIGDKKGFHLPNVALVDVMNKAPFDEVSEGLLVYNTNPEIINGNGIGIYIYINNKWIRSGENADHYLIKDYRQSASIKLSERPVNTVKDIVTIGSNTFTLQGECEIKSEEENTSKYCLYTVPSSVTWSEAYNLSRNIEIDGYLPIIASASDQQNLKNFLINKGINSNIWLGTRKVNHTNSVNDESDYFIPYYNNLIGKSVGIDWSNRPEKYHNFLELEPNNNNRLEGCVLMLGAGLGSTSTGVVLEQDKWVDTSCTINNFVGVLPLLPNTGEFKNIVVEIGYF